MPEEKSISDLAQVTGGTESTSHLAEIFRDKPPVDSSRLPPMLNASNGQCVHCKKFTPMKSMPILDSGIILAQEPLCSECAATFEDQAKIVCITCKVVLLWVDPQKEPTGFEFKKGKIYHVQNCPTCKSDIEHAQVMEKVIFYQENNIPYE